MPSNAGPERLAGPGGVSATGTMPPSRAPHVLVCLAVLAAFAAHAAYYWPSWTDDAYISFRYARNLAAGNGLVFNPGDRLEGMTNLAWTVLLAPATAGDPMFAAKVIGLACSALTIALVGAWAWEERLHPAATAAALAPFALLPWAPFWSVQGLETPAVALLVTLGWSRYPVEARDPTRWPLSAVGLGLAPAFRPDAAVHAPVTALVHLLRRGPRDTPLVRRSIAIVIACAGALVAFKLGYYGQILPHTYAVKTGSHPLPMGEQYLASWLQVPTVGFGALSIVAASALASFVVRRDDRALPGLLVLAAVAGTVVTGGDYFANFRMFVPVLPAMGACVARIADMLIRRSGQVVLGWDAVAVLLAAAILPQVQVNVLDRLRDPAAFPTPTVTMSIKDAPLWAPWTSMSWNRGMGEVWVFPAAWVLVHADPAEVLAFTDIGLLSFLNQNPLRDLLGLTDAALTVPEGVTPQAFWKGPRERLPDEVDLLVLDRGSSRWGLLRPQASSGWAPIDGCDNVRVFASTRRGREAAHGIAPGVEARIDAMFTHTPRFPTLHVAVLRELVAGGADPALVDGVLARAEALAGEPWQLPMRTVACQLGRGDGCTPHPEQCGGSLAGTR
jgi:hypothetical protein